MPEHGWKEMFALFFSGGGAFWVFASFARSMPKPPRPPYALFGREWFYSWIYATCQVIAANRGFRK